MNPPPVTAYPVQWPAGFPRTSTREKGLFRVTLPMALEAVRIEVSKLGGTGLVLSSNVTLGDNKPADPSVVAYFERQGQRVAIPCDRWTLVEHNLRAIANTLEAMRSIERWGAKHMVQAMFSGLAGLPAPAPDDWRAVLKDPKTLAEAEAVYRSKMRDAHPDRPSGSDVAAKQLNAAIAEARTYFK